MKKLLSTLTVAVVALFTSASAQNVSSFTVGDTGINDALIMDSSGNIYGANFGIPSSGTSSLYKVTPDGTVTEFSTGYSACNGLAFDHDENLYAVDFTNSDANHQIYKLDSDGNKTAYGPPVPGASGIVFDPLSDTLYVSQYTGSTHTISKLAPDGEIVLHTDDENLNGPVGMVFDNEDRLIVGNFNDGKIFRITDYGTTVTEIAEIPSSSTTGIGFLAYAKGNIYATGMGVHQLFCIKPDGEVITLAGTGLAGLKNGLASEAKFNRPNGICTNNEQDVLYVSDYTTEVVRKITDLGLALNVEESSELPQTILYQNVPNPARSFTTITYQLKEANMISLKLYNYLGQETNIFSEFKQAGKHTYQLATTELTNGLYYLELRNGNDIQNIAIKVLH